MELKKETGCQKKQETKTKQHTCRSVAGVHTMYDGQWTHQTKRVKINRKGHSTAMDCYFMKVNSSEESVRCIAVKEGRHQNMMSSVALKKGVKETWAIERGVRFIGLLGYLQDHGGHGASNHCVQKPCDRNVQSRRHNRGCSERRQAIERAHLARRSQRRLTSLGMVGGTCRQHTIHVSEKVATGENHLNETVTRVCPVWSESVYEADFNRTHEQTEPPDTSLNLGSEMRSNSAKCFIGKQTVC